VNFKSLKNFIPALAGFFLYWTFCLNQNLIFGWGFVLKYLLNGMALFAPKIRRRLRRRNISCTFLLLQKSTKKAGPKTIYGRFRLCLD